MQMELQSTHTLQPILKSHLKYKDALRNSTLQRLQPLLIRHMLYLVGELSLYSQDDVCKLCSLSKSFCFPLHSNLNSHVKVKHKGAVQNMLRRLDKIRFRGQKREEYPYLAESPNASDTECGDEITLKLSRPSKDNEELKDPVSIQ